MFEAFLSTFKLILCGLNILALWKCKKVWEYEVSSILQQREN